MRARLTGLAAILLLAACSGDEETGTPNVADTGASFAQESRGTQVSTDESAPAPTLADRTREITNPDEFSIVLLYHSLAGDNPPIDKWVEDDVSVRYAPPIEKAAARESLRAKVNSGLAAMKDVGAVRIALDANLSEFDPSFNEYTVRAFSPSSVVYFKSLGEQVGVKFGNAQKAQRWSLNPAESQTIRDRIKYPSDVTLEALLKVTGAMPEPTGGTITANVVEYELKSRSSGTTVVRVVVM